MPCLRFRAFCRNARNSAADPPPEPPPHVVAFFFGVDLPEGFSPVFFVGRGFVAPLPFSCFAAGFLQSAIDGVSFRRRLQQLQPLPAGFLAGGDLLGWRPRSGHETALSDASFVEAGGSLRSGTLVLVVGIQLPMKFGQLIPRHTVSEDAVDEPVEPARLDVPGIVDP